MTPGKDLRFIFFLLDTPSGLCYYRDAAGNVQTAPMDSSFPVNMRRAPDGWMNQELGFMRNAHYWGLNRSYALPHKLIDDAAIIVRTVTSQGRGIEVPLTMLVYKFNGNPQPGDPLYELYYKGQIDLPKAENIWMEGVQCNLMEGGFTQLLKAYEKTMYEIPCDGSIPENIKMNMDGMLFEDKFHYQIVPFVASTPGDCILPATFISNEGDNAGIIYNSPAYEQRGSNYFQQSTNFLFSSQSDILVTIEGSITVRNSDGNQPVSFDLYLATSKSVTIGTDSLSYCTNLAPRVPSDYPLSEGLPNQTKVAQQTVFFFKATVPLAARERLFMVFFNQFEHFPVEIMAGSFTLSFASQFPATYPWCITLFDLGKKLIELICKDASVNGQTFNYQFVSQLLQDNLNLVATAGDALRASGDSNYQRFYNAVINNPNFPSTGVSFFYGPVIKTCLSDYFDAVNVILNAAMSTQVLPGQGETIFIEKKGYVLNAAVKNLDNGEVTEVRDMAAMDLLFTLVKIGYEPQQYDQKAGKFAWNTTLELVSTLKTIPSKILDLVTKYLTDPYLIEKLRSDTGETSTTRNANDAQIFVINRDVNNYVFDSFTGRFDSEIRLVPNAPGGDPGGAGNTNLLLQTRQWLQGIGLPAITGSYLSYSSLPGIFLFNQPSLSGGSFNINVLIAGNLIGYPASALTGLPADQVTIKLWVNGAVIQSWTVVASAPSTPIAITYVTTRAFSFKDAIWLTADTSVNGTASFNCQLTIDTGSPYLIAIGSNITVEPGAIRSVVSLPDVTPAMDGNGRPVMSYGFQYFQFNSVLLNPNFNITPSLTAAMTGGTTGQRAGFDLYLNGVPVNSQTFVRNMAIADQGFGFLPGFGSPVINHDFQQGDIVFMVGSTENINFFVFDAILQLQSTQIKCYNLKRVQYDAIYGIPTLLGNMPGTAIPITTGPGAPYNIEDLTPARLARKHGNYFRSILYDQIPGALTFSKLSKNEYLTTQLGSEVIRENADIQIGDFEKQLFKARYITYKARVQETFATIQTGAANAFVGATINGVDASGFPMDMKQKPALNEMQEWKMLAGPDFDFTTLINPAQRSLQFLNMKNNSLYVSPLSPVQFVPDGQILPVYYKTANRRLFWFIEQVSGWINQNNYWQPWMQADYISLQCVTRDLTAVKVNVYSCTGTDPIASYDMVEKSSPAMLDGYHLWELTIDPSTLNGLYYLTMVAGAGANTVTFISEGLWVRGDWPGTIRFTTTHSSNQPSMVFDTGYTPMMRVRGYYDNMFDQEYTGTFYKDQGQNIKIINGIPYEVTDLICGLDDGIPWWQHNKVHLWLLNDGTTLDGEAYSLDENAKWEKTFIEGNPKRYQKISIRPSQANQGVSMDIGGFIDDTVIMASLDAGAAGPNAGNAGSNTPNIVTIQITP